MRWVFPRFLSSPNVFLPGVRQEIEEFLVRNKLAFADGETVITGHMDEAEKKAFILTLDRMAEKRKKTGKEIRVTIPRVLNNEESKCFFEANRVLYPKMDIRIPFLTVREILRYRPALDAAKVVCPTLVVTAENDTVNPPSQGLALFNAAGAREKRLYQQKDARHYDMYTGMFFKKAVLLQTEWFNKYL
ncbi:alpha/beta hydrolase [Pantoea rwandensis]|uniref:Peptidase S9 prolyl oligopeptidase catalytic domain-containing protein n=1 Tax=Pantoea rwandensis TaxID=1076550 RepID=A0A1X1D386_9GAMM|nr:alpha/beta hydrolase [Pantoea rwandensis]ORM71107.1 hypothetical protein HA51_04270 [Pantoea rwandensis]